MWFTILRFSHQENQCRHPGSERTPDSEIGGKDEEEEEIEEERGRGGAGALPEPVGWPLEDQARDQRLRIHGAEGSGAQRRQLQNPFKTNPPAQKAAGLGLRTGSDALCWAFLRAEAPRPQSRQEHQPLVAWLYC